MNFAGYQGKKILEIGCGVGIDLIQFAKNGADVLGIDLADSSIDLAGKYFDHAGAKGKFVRMDGEAMEFEDNSFDMVYAHGVIQYTANASRMIEEIYRVTKPGGEAIMMVYNRISWLNFLSKIMKVELEHEDAPVLKKYSIAEFEEMLSVFSSVKIIPERFPVKSRLHKGLKAILYNGIFVTLFNMIPKFIVRPLGWHIMVFAYKQEKSE